MKKGQKELTMIISLIILLVVAVVTISLFLQFFGGKLDIGQDAIEQAQFEAKCQGYCSAISTAVSDNVGDAIWDYCYYAAILQKSDYSELVIRGSGASSFCRDGVHCFNIEGSVCTARGRVITPYVCLETMCKNLITAGKSKAKAEELIKERMHKGNCNLREGAKITVGNEERVIDVPTWWELLFEHPNCSMTSGFIPDNGGDTPPSTGCVAACRDEGHSGATSEDCASVLTCVGANIPLTQAEICADSPDPTFGCCCTP